MAKIRYVTPDGAGKFFEVAEDGTGAPPEPWAREGEPVKAPESDPEMVAMLAEAERLEIKVDRRWGKAKLYEKIAEKLAGQGDGDDGT